MTLKVTVLGSGTSSGVPTVGCSCEVCLSTDPRDKRLRPSILLQYGGRNIVVDTTPDFRTQALRVGLQHLDAVVYTHGHADHILGLDDVRPFNYQQRSHIPIYASAITFDVIRRIFDYAFSNKPQLSTVPKLDVNIFEEAPFEVLGLEFEPIPLVHGNMVVYGFRIGNIAYLTDHGDIPEASLAKLHGLDVLFLDALRHKPHPTHSSLENSIATAKRLGAKRTYFTHMCHDLPHAETEQSLPPGIFLAYDGLQLEVSATG
jgi:phosphoribosyl 1,2-cyclic phosphate phosphodiesterase